MQRSITKEVYRLLSILALSSLAIYAAYQVPGDIFLDFGPNDHEYVQGFREDFEIDEPTIFHWSSDRATVSLPFHINGSFDVTLRYKRHISSPAEVLWFNRDELLDKSNVPQQDFELKNFHSKNQTSEALKFHLLSNSNDPRPLGIALDWMQIRPSNQLFAVRPTNSALLALTMWVVAFYLVPRSLGLGFLTAAITSICATLMIVGMAVSHKLWPVHAATTLGFGPLAFAFILVFFLLIKQRSNKPVFTSPEYRWIPLIILAGFSIRLFALFHPDFYYPDIRTHSKFVYLLWNDGLFEYFSNYIEKQHNHLLGLQLIGEKWVAFPYPPLLYLVIYPLSLISMPVENWMKIVPTAIVSLEGLLLFITARKLNINPRITVIAVILHSTARVLAFRLSVASYAAILGHFCDFITISYLLYFFDRLHRFSYLLGLSCLVAIALLSYAGSALVLGFFIPVFCIVFGLQNYHQEKTMQRLICVAGSSLFGALAALFIFYWQYIPEIITSAHSTSTLNDLIEISFTPLNALTMGMNRLYQFYGLFGFIALSSLYFLRRQHDNPFVFSLCTSSVITYLGMNFLRAGLGNTHIFQFSKDDLVLLPVIVLSLATLANRWQNWKISQFCTIILITTWVVWGNMSLARDIQKRFIRPDYIPFHAIVDSRSNDIYSTKFSPDPNEPKT